MGRMQIIWVGCLLSLAGVLLASCGDDDGDGAAVPEGCDAFVAPTGSAEGDQDAVVEAIITAGADSTVCFRGEYQFTDEVAVADDGVTLRGLGDEGATWDFSAQEVGANGVHAQSVDGFVMENITVTNPAGDGIRLTSNTNAVLRNVGIIWEAGPVAENGAYGFYPVESDGVLLENCRATGASDAGVYVGQSRNIIIRGCETWENVSGIQIENSVNAEVYNNRMYDNTAGFLTLDLPDLPAGNGGGIKVHDNVIENNNTGNFAAIGTIAARVPPGTGAMILAIDDVDFHDNEVRGNASTGVLLVSYRTVQALGETRPVEEAYDPYPETIYIHDNTFADNGDDPQGMLVGLTEDPTLEDIIWDGLMAMDAVPSDVLCLQNNGDAGYLDFQVIVEEGSSGLETGEPKTDASVHDCTFPGRDPVELDL